MIRRADNASGKYDAWFNINDKSDGKEEVWTLGELLDGQWMKMKKEH